MQEEFQDNACRPLSAFLMGKKKFDFLLIDMSFYFKYPVLLTKGTSISEPLKSNFPHGAPKRLTNFQRIFFSFQKCCISLSICSFFFKTGRETLLSASPLLLSPVSFVQKNIKGPLTK